MCSNLEVLFPHGQTDRWFNIQYKYYAMLVYGILYIHIEGGDVNLL